MTITAADLAAAQAENEQISRLTEPLADPRLEACVQMLRPWLSADTECELRWAVTQTPDDALAMLAKARLQTGADALATALWDAFAFLTDQKIGTYIYMESAGFYRDKDEITKKMDAALAAYERIAK